MKTIALWAMLVVLHPCLIAQDTVLTPTTKPATAESLFAKSRRQNTTGWILIGSGLLLQGTGIISGIFSLTNDIAGNDSQSEKDLTKAKVLFYSGLAALGTGIGFTIAGAVTKRKAKLAMGTGQLWLTPQTPLGQPYTTVKVTLAL